MLYFLNRQPQQWKDTYVKSFVTLAGPWGGAVKGTKVLQTTLISASPPRRNAHSLP